MVNHSRSHYQDTYIPLTLLHLIYLIIPPRPQSFYKALAAPR